MVYDVQSLTETLRKFGNDLGLPKVNVDRLIETQRKQIEALRQAAQIAASGSEALVQKQQEVFEAGMREASAMARNYKLDKNPQEMLAKQTEYAKKAFDITMQNARDITEITGRSTSDVMEIVRNRLTESIEEIFGSAVTPIGEKQKK